VVLRCVSGIEDRPGQHPADV